MSDETTTTTPETAEAPPAPMADSGFMDSVSSQPPVVKPGTYPAIIEEFTEQSDASGNVTKLAWRLSLHGSDMLDTEGNAVQPGKIITGNMFVVASAEYPDMQPVVRRKKALLMALHDVPNTKQGDETVKTWPPEDRLQSPYDIKPFQPYEKWKGTRVLAIVKIRTTDTGSINDAGTLLAASTPTGKRK